MPDLEKVIKGLKCISGDVVWCAYCPYSSSDGSGRGERCKREAAKDALALLKAQEPRVMTLEEVFVWAEMPAEKRDPIFFEQKIGPTGWICNSACPKDYYLYCEDGDARCWTSRPSKEEMEAIPW